MLKFVPNCNFEHISSGVWRELKGLNNYLAWKSQITGDRWLWRQDGLVGKIYIYDLGTYEEHILPLHGSPVATGRPDELMILSENKCYLYNVDKRKTKSIEGYPHPEGGRSARVVLDNGDLLVVGGKDYHEEQRFSEHGRSAIFRYKKKRWELIPNGKSKSQAPAARLSDGSVVFANYASGFGSTSGDKRFDPATKAWLTPIPDLDTYSFTQKFWALASGELLACGGFAPRGRDEATHEVRLYSPSANQWTRLKSIPLDYYGDLRHSALIKHDGETCGWIAPGLQDSGDPENPVQAEPTSFMICGFNDGVLQYRSLPTLPQLISHHHHRIMSLSGNRLLFICSNDKAQSTVYEWD